ncbi:hypothetical protein GE300_11730 [Rhodobacteraceae bacterium 2CG4]|uniref:Uncharacterized protein n=1 Tax=Halovulum marinum TaxID=2662447 RepID=A0A6L5Z154_9RHOB|nr:hypothetical protein [Halovulum marinum]MSU90281.1 hypothetical protein [Halovulum marinum]
MAKGLQIDEDRQFQERFWKAERIAWICFAAILLAALAGMTGGGGPLAHGSAEQADTQVIYPRISRWRADETLTLVLGPGDGLRQILMPKKFLDVFELESIQPEPLGAVAEPEGLRLSFAATGAGAMVRLGIRARKAGFVRYAITIDDESPVRLATFVFP